MNSRSSSITTQTSATRPPNSGRRLSRRISTIPPPNEAQHDEAGPEPAHQVITEEIEEIKRYEDFTTIDWVQDAAKEQLRRRARRREAGFSEREGRPKWKRKLWESYDAGQAWLVVTLVGAAIGLNAAFLNIITEWLADMKLGYCSTAFYLNEQFCCWGAEDGKGIHMTAALERC